MRTLILSWGTGGGYTTAAQAVREKLEEHGHEVTCLDLHSLEGEKTGSFRLKLSIYQKNSRNEYKVQQYLAENEFDVIIVTHILPALLLSILRRNHVPLPEIIYVVSDYTCVPFTEETCCDCYVIPSEKLTAEFCRRGVPGEKILSVGIPVRKAFLNGMTRAQAREMAGLQQETYYILLSAENMGAGKLKRVMRSLQVWLDWNKNARLIVVDICSDRVFRRVGTKFETEGRIQLIQKAQDTAVLRKACDVVITGAGGTVSTETAVLGNALIQLSPSGSSERRNAEFFARYGMSITVKKPGIKLIQALRTLEDESVREDMIKAQRSHVSQLAAAEICNLVESREIAVETGIVSLLV